MVGGETIVVGGETISEGDVSFKSRLLNCFCFNIGKVTSG